MDHNATPAPPPLQPPANQADTPQVESPTAMVDMSHNIPEAFQQAAQAVPSTESAANPSPPPLSAADGDLIEKAWVEKAEQVIAAHKYDPHTLELAADTLNQAYLKQRFGLDIKSSPDKG